MELTYVWVAPELVAIATNVLRAVGGATVCWEGDLACAGRDKVVTEVPLHGHAIVSSKFSTNTLVKMRAVGVAGTTDHLNEGMFQTEGKQTACEERFIH